MHMDKKKIYTESQFLIIKQFKGTVQRYIYDWKVVSVKRSHLRREVLEFSADFIHPFSCKRPFKFPHHLVQALGIDRKIALADANIHSALFILTQTGTRTQTQIWITWNWGALLSTKRFNSPYSPVWITYEISRCQFQWCYILEMSLSIENNDMQIFKNSYHHWDTSPNYVLMN
jgi:hypothetical protein